MLLLTEATGLALHQVRSQVDEVEGEPGDTEAGDHGGHQLVHLTQIRIEDEGDSASASLWPSWPPPPVSASRSWSLAWPGYAAAV